MRTLRSAVRKGHDSPSCRNRSSTPPPAMSVASSVRSNLSIFSSHADSQRCAWATLGLPRKEDPSHRRDGPARRHRPRHRGLQPRNRNDVWSPVDGGDGTRPLPGRSLASRAITQRNRWRLWRRPERAAGRQASRCREFLQQRLEINYFAASCLMPEQASVSYLSAAKEHRDLAIEDFRDAFGSPTKPRRCASRTSPPDTSTSACTSSASAATARSTRRTRTTTYPSRRTSPAPSKDSSCTPPRQHARPSLAPAGPPSTTR